MKLNLGGAATLPCVADSELDISPGAYKRRVYTFLHYLTTTGMSHFHPSGKEKNVLTRQKMSVSVVFIFLFHYLFIEFKFANFH